MSDEVVAALVGALAGAFAAVLASSVFTIWFDNQRRKDSKREEARRNAEQVLSLIARIVVQGEKEIDNGKQIAAVFEVQQDLSTQNNGFRVIGYLYDQLLKLKGSEFEEASKPLLTALNDWLVPRSGTLSMDVLKEGQRAIEAKLKPCESRSVKPLK